MKCHECGEQIGKSGICESCQTQEILVPGTMLENRYNIISVVGRGGMGFVYKALDSRLHNTVVAIKEMRGAQKKGKALSRSVKSFESEAAMLSKLRHPALPRILDFFSSESRWYLVMDFIDGQNLDEYIKNKGPISETQARAWARELCDVLDYLHSQNPPVIFRDLKPSNIMLDMSGQLKVVDFGIARHFKVDTASDTTYYFSSGFSPPEQYGAGQTDSRSDIYSLGATLHYIVSGIHPKNTPFVFKPLGAVANVSSQFNEAVMAAVSIDPNGRPSSAREMQAMLDGEYQEEYVSSDMTQPLDGSDSTPPVAVKQPAKKRLTGNWFVSVKDKVTKRPLIAGLVLLFLLAGSAVAGVLLQGATEGHNISEHLASAALFFDDHDYEQAILAYQEVISIDPRNTDARIGLAKSYVASGQTNLAKEELEELITLNPTMDQPYILLAQIYIDEGNLTQAASVLREGLDNTDSLALQLLLAEVSSMIAREDSESPTIPDSGEGGISEMIEGSGNYTSDVFSLQDPNYLHRYGFQVALDSFPGDGERVHWELKLFLVGQDQPIRVFDGSTTGSELREWGWTPSKMSNVGGKQVAGVALGFFGNLFPELGDYYFEVEVSDNVDRWYLEVRDEPNQEKQAEGMDEPEILEDISDLSFIDLYAGIFSNGSKETPVFTVPEDGSTYLFTIMLMLDELPDAHEHVTCDAALYRVGEDTPVWSSNWVITRSELEKRAWSPSHVEIEKESNVLRGIVAGAGGISFPGPGSYYFVINVSGVDRWYFHIDR